MSQKPVILVVCDYYLPGFESGGAVRTLANTADRLGHLYDFRIITRDHDGTANRTPYTTVNIGEWNRVGNAEVYYLSKDQIRPRSIAKLINDVSADAIYLNSFFGRLTIFFLALLKLRRINPVPIILAPEGEFSPGALSLNPVRKQLYIRHAKLLRLLKKFVWKAASESEKHDIETIFGDDLDIHLAPNMPPRVIFENYDQAAKPAKVAGQARLIFLSRFMRKKNFNWLLERLRTVTGDLSIDICGTLEERDYWDECVRITQTLPPNIRIESKGPVPHEQVLTTLARYDFFILPTLGENFGHVFLEALASGCPLVISDRTPWRNLEKEGTGWDLPLEDPSAWVGVLNRCIAMKNDEYQRLSAAARTFAVSWLSDPDIEKSNVAVLNAALRRKIGQPARL
jgi:glycosyltransferase involved in cell wall biosynthesis